MTYQLNHKLLIIKFELWCDDRCGGIVRLFLSFLKTNFRFLKLSIMEKNSNLFKCALRKNEKEPEITKSIKIPG